MNGYLDGGLALPDRSFFRAHSLCCRACRGLLSDVKALVDDCKEIAQTDLLPDLSEGLPSGLEAALVAIPERQGASGCLFFEDLITEFLDGFVPAEVYHRFEAHATECGGCSDLLTGVVYAVAACHSVHTYEQVTPSEQLVERLLLLAPAPSGRMKAAISDRAAALVERLFPRRSQGPRWTLVTGSALACATFFALLFGFSDDGTVGGIYRQAHVRAARVYSEGADIYAEKDEVVARIEKVGYGIGEIWDTIGGAANSRSQQNSNQADHGANSNKSASRLNEAQNN